MMHPRWWTTIATGCLELNRVITFVRGLGLGVGTGANGGCSPDHRKCDQTDCLPLHPKKFTCSVSWGPQSSSFAGPFYAEGLLQGLVGGVGLAGGTLWRSNRYGGAGR